MHITYYNKISEYDQETPRAINHMVLCRYNSRIIVSEYDQEIPQSQTADNPVAPRGRATQPSLDTRKTNQAKQPALSSPSR